MDAKTDETAQVPCSYSINGDCGNIKNSNSLPLFGLDIETTSVHLRSTNHQQHIIDCANSSKNLSDDVPFNLNSKSIPSMKEEPSRRRGIPSRNSLHNCSYASTSSDDRANLILQNVGRTFHRTHSQLRRTKLLHIFYVAALLGYTIIGALIFQALDGEHDDSMRAIYEKRCQSERSAKLQELQDNCTNDSNTCFKLMSAFVSDVENCYRNWHKHNLVIIYPMSDFTNAIVYAFSVYSTIGYGNMAANTLGGRVATVIYGIIGIPIFFAFIKEEGNLFRICFIRLYKYICKQKRSIFGNNRDGMNHRNYFTKREKINKPVITFLNDESDHPKADPQIKTPNFMHKKNGDYHQDYKEIYKSTSEQRKVFMAAVFVFIAYLIVISEVFTIMASWDYFTAFYFLFNSVALIGFGDVFPSNSKIILVNTFFITLGIILYSMCYFILQEEIREKAFEASRKARMSITKYSQSIIQHTRNPWSRQYSPAFDGVESRDLSPFERFRKRRQSAPAVALSIPTRSTINDSPSI